MGSEAPPATSHTALQHHMRAWRQLNAECMRNVQHTKTYMHCSFISKVKVIDLCATRQILKIYREVFSTQALLHLPGASCASLTGSRGRRRSNSPSEIGRSAECPIRLSCSAFEIECPNHVRDSILAQLRNGSRQLLDQTLGQCGVVVIRRPNLHG